MRPNRLSRMKSSMNNVLFVNADIGFSENLYLVYHVPFVGKGIFNLFIMYPLCNK